MAVQKVMTDLFSKIDKDKTAMEAMIFLIVASKLYRQNVVPSDEELMHDYTTLALLFEKYNSNTDKIV